MKRQREQAKREKQQAKAARKAERKSGDRTPGDDIAMDELVREGEIPAE